ncbi:unnamed protein product [Lymnaea stagnalis]|uniref:Uncharacterized protein n=1 Tax=Lymnaea stagnalis TaxID=6523 RepID=A0AAV2IKU5_LYMST
MDQDCDLLFEAIKTGNNRQVETLLESKRCHPDSCAKDSFNTPAIVMAAQLNHTECLQCLCLNEIRANVDATDSMNWTASMHAADKSFIEILRILKHFNANFNLINLDGSNALMVAAKSGHDECVRFLINRTLNINQENREGYTALSYAVQACNVDTVQMLLDANAEVNVVDHEKGYSPLMHALNSIKLHTAIVLLNRKADVNVVGLDGKTALSYAFHFALNHCFGDTLFAQLVLLHGADMRLSRSDQSYLHKMIATGSLRVVRQMVLNGCQPFDNSCKYCFGIEHHEKPVSPLYAALFSGHDNIARYFIINNFYTHSDICSLTSNQELQKRLEECSQYNSGSIAVLNHLRVWSPHLSLYNVCLVAVREVLKFHIQTTNTMIKTLPQKIQDDLLFKGKCSHLCTRVWCFIS